jgi:regulator of sirC expression with transglutaminase-like and TPR domain
MAFLRAAEEMQLGAAAYERAVDDLKRSIGLDATQPGVHSNLGMAYARLSRPELALEAFAKAIELMPEEPQFFVMRAMVHARLDDDKQAVADLSAALSLAPNDRAMFNRANAYRRLGELENAMADYRTIIETTNNPQVKSDAEHNLAALTE